MAPRAIKRKSDETTGEVEDAHDIATETITTKAGCSSEQRASRHKRQRTGLSLSHKQALIDNLQLEITERARKLRAQYNLQAQGLRTRIEIRVNRIPMALRKAEMGGLADKYRNGQPPQARPTPSHTTLHSSRPPPLPEKGTPLARAESFTSAASHTIRSSRRPGPGRPPKRTGNDIFDDSQSRSGEVTGSEVPRKKLLLGGDANKAYRVLSPSSANIRAQSRPMPTAKPPRARPLHVNENTPGPLKLPTKQSSMSNLLGSWAEKARSPRKKASTATMSSVSGSGRGRKPGETTTTSNIEAAAARTQRRISGISESSESSSSTVAENDAEKQASSAKKASPAKKARGVMGSIRRGVAGAATKKATQKKAAPTSTATGRVLRNRGLK